MHCHIALIRNKKQLRQIFNNTYMTERNIHMVTVITGLNNSGKSTLANFLKGWGYKPVLEYTTRPMREGEKNNMDYHFISDEKFNKMNTAGEFAEVLIVQTVHGLWKYGATKKDLKTVENDYLLVCGPSQVGQLIDSGVSALTILLDIDRETARKRAMARGTIGDDLEEFERRFTADELYVNAIRNKVSMVLDATNSIEVNARAIDNRLTSEKYEEIRKKTDSSRKQKYFGKE